MFEVLDYLSRWLQLKRKAVNDARIAGARGTLNSADFDELKEVSHISSVERIIDAIPSNVIAQRAVECHSYRRALFHWEDYLRVERNKADKDLEVERVLQRMQDIYGELNEPDGVEGMSGHFHILDPEQQVRDLQKNGKWAAAQSWYELDLESQYPTNAKESSQLGLLTCLKESGQSGKSFVTHSSPAPTHIAKMPF